MTGFEKPANQGSSVQAARAKYGQTYYDQYAGTSTTESNVPSYTVDKVYNLQVDRLMVRKGPGTGYTAVSYANLTDNAKANAYSNGTLKKGTKVTCQAVQTVGSDIWIQIPSGWIAAYYNGETYVM